MSIKIIFKNNDEYNKCIEFKDSITIKEMIIEYSCKCGLSEEKKTIEYHSDKDGSVKKLEIKPDYRFIYNGRILDRKNKTTLNNFFKNKKNVIIRVFDSSIMGGNNSMIDQKRKI